MSEINVTPHTEDSNTNLLVILALIIIVTGLGVFGYRNEWFMTTPSIMTPAPSSNINITLPPAVSNPAPNPTLTLDPTVPASPQDSGSTETDEY